MVLVQKFKIVPGRGCVNLMNMVSKISGVNKFDQNPISYLGFLIGYYPLILQKMSKHVSEYHPYPEMRDI